MALAVEIGAPYHPVHHANAWEEEEEAAAPSAADRSRSGGGGGTRLVHLLSSCWPPAAVRRLASVGSSLLGSWEELIDGDFSGVPNTNLVRFTIELPELPGVGGEVVGGVAAAGGDAAGGVSRRPRVRSHTILAAGAQLDHPRVHPQWSTRRTRFVFGTLGRRDNGGEEDAVPAPPQSFGCVDVDAAGGAGELIDSWFAGERRLVDECTLVPMSSQRGGEGGAEAVGAEAEDERACWLIAPIFDGATRESSYVVLDGRDLARGPVCEWAVGTFIPWGLHGSWRGASGRRTTMSSK